MVANEMAVNKMALNDMADNEEDANEMVVDETIVEEVAGDKIVVVEIAEFFSILKLNLVHYNFAWIDSRCKIDFWAT